MVISDKINIFFVLLVGDLKDILFVDFYKYVLG